MNRKEMIAMIGAYYTSIGRLKTPQYQEYSLGELRKVIILFKIK